MKMFATPLYISWFHLASVRIGAEFSIVSDAYGLESAAKVKSTATAADTMVKNMLKRTSTSRPHASIPTAKYDVSDVNFMWKIGRAYSAIGALYFQCEWKPEDILRHVWQSSYTSLVRRCKGGGAYTGCLPRATATAINNTRACKRTEVH